MSPLSISKRDAWLAVAGLFGLIFLTYARVWQAGFIWDDDIHLTLNPCITGSKGLLDIWTSSEARICPLTLTTFWLEYQIWGLNPLAFHLVNVVVHALNAVLLWRVLLGLGVRGAWFGAALWALHPVQVETVAWITELKNTQSGFFFLLTLLAFIRWRRQGRGYGLVIACSVLAMASKSSTVVLPAVLGLLWWWLDGKWAWRNGLRLLPIAVLSVLSALLSIWTQVLEGGITDEWHLTPPERLITAGKIVWAYLATLVKPYPLIFIYPKWELHAEDWVSYLPSLAVVLAALGLWWWRARWRAVFMAFALFVVLLLPVLGLVDHFFLRYSFVGDHFQYLASMAPLALAAAGVSRWKTWLASAGAAFLLAVMALLSWHHSRIFVNTEVLWRHTVSMNPKCWLGLNNLGFEQLQKGDLAGGAALVRRALELNPTDVSCLMNLSSIQQRMGQPEEAIATMQKALGYYERNPQAHNNLGMMLLGQGRLDEAVTHFRKSIEHGANGVLPRLMLGTALLQKGRVDEAVAEWQRVLVMRPASADAHANLCLVLAQKDDVETAIRHGEQAVTHEPGFAAGFNALGTALAKAGRMGEACARYEQALVLDPNLAAAHFNLAQIFISRRKIIEAMEHLESAARVMPVSEQVVVSLSWLLATCPDGAIRDTRRAIHFSEASHAEGKERSAAFLRAKAAALAAVSRFEEACLDAEQGIALLERSPSDQRITLSGLSPFGMPDDAELLRLMKSELELYRQHKPVLDQALMPVLAP